MSDRQMVKYICCISDDLRYRWEAKVLAVNLLNHGVDKDNIIFLVAKKSCCLSDKALELNKYATVYAFPDTRTTSTYSSSIRFNLLKQYVAMGKGKGAHLYIDSDIIFRELPDFSKMQEDKVYLSDTISYIGADYIKKCDSFLFHMMCDIVDISARDVERREKSSGGAQYYFPKGLPNIFDKCEKNSEELFSKISSELQQQLSKLGKNLEHYRKLQIWCADMWALLWNIWKDGKETEVTEELSFSWGSSHRLEYYNRKIYHNAGVTENRKSETFYKAAFNNIEPFHHVFDYVHPDSNTIHYIEAIRAVENFRNRNSMLGVPTKTTGIVILATNNYFPLGLRLINRLSFLYKGQTKLKFYLFSNLDPSEYIREGVDVTWKQTSHSSWVEGAMDKFNCIYSLWDEPLDNILYLDADTNIEKEFTDTDLYQSNKGMTFYKHGYPSKRSDGLDPFSDDVNTRCYIPYKDAVGKQYHYGAIFFGDRQSMLNFCAICKIMMDYDLSKGVVSPIHDESYLNYYTCYNDHQSISDKVFAHSQKAHFSGRDHKDLYFDKKLELLKQNREKLYDYYEDISILQNKIS